MSDPKLTDDEIEAAEDAQCDALCRPDFHRHPNGAIVCFGCGKMVTLLPGCADSLIRELPNFTRMRCYKCDSAIAPARARLSSLRPEIDVDLNRFRATARGVAEPL